MTVLTSLAGGAIGRVVGYLVGRDWLYPISTLCGIYGAFFTGLVVVLAGTPAGWLATRPHRQ